jgi:hypothetical protein
MLRVACSRAIYSFARRSSSTILRPALSNPARPTSSSPSAEGDAVAPRRPCPRPPHHRRRAGVLFRGDRAAVARFPPSGRCGLGERVIERATGRPRSCRHWRLPTSICSLFCCLLHAGRTDAVGTFAGISAAFRCSVVTSATGITRPGLMNHQSKQSFAVVALGGDPTHLRLF